MDSKRYPYLVVRTKYHCGGIASRHETRGQAEDAARALRTEGCICGCAGVIHASNYEYLLSIDETESPYPLVRV